MIGKGKIDIAIPKTNFNPGEVISGIVTLTMKKTAKARKFTISLIGEQKITQSRGARAGQQEKSVSTSLSNVWIEKEKIVKAPILLK